MLIGGYDHHPEDAGPPGTKKLMSKIIEETKDIAKVESQPKFEGKQMVMIIQPI